MSANHDDRHAREDRRNEFASRKPVAPIAVAHASFNRRLAELQDVAARSTGSLLLQDPRDLANRVRQFAEMAAVEEQPSSVTWATIGALALAGWVGAARSEELRVDTGDAA